MVEGQRLQLFTCNTVFSFAYLFYQSHK